MNPNEAFGRFGGVVNKLIIFYRRDPSICSRKIIQFRQFKLFNVGSTAMLLSIMLATNLMEQKTGLRNVRLINVNKKLSSRGLQTAHADRDSQFNRAPPEGSSVDKTYYDYRTTIIVLRLS